MAVWGSASATACRTSRFTSPLLNAASWYTSNRPVTGFARTIPMPGDSRRAVSKRAATRGRPRTTPTSQRWRPGTTDRGPTKNARRFPVMASTSDGISLTASRSRRTHPTPKP